MRITRTLNLVVTALVSAAAFTTTPLAAQEGTNAVTTGKPAEPGESPERPPYWPWSIDFGAGTDGLLGGGVQWRFSDHLGTRVGVGYTEAHWEHLRIGGLKYSATLRLLSEPLTLDIYPWRKSSFRISLGMLVNQNEMSGSVSSTGTITIGGEPIEITPGSITMRIKQQPVNPYLSIGGNLLYFDHAHHWALAGELGVAFTGDSRASVDRSGSSALPDEVLDEVKSRLQHYANQFTWWPVAALTVKFSF